MDKKCKTNFTFLKSPKRGRISEIATDCETPVCGFGFGKSKEDSYQFWMPVPAHSFYKGKVAKDAQRRSSFRFALMAGRNHHALYVAHSTSDKYMKISRQGVYSLCRGVNIHLSGCCCFIRVS